MSLIKQSIAELIGTFWLVFGGCGAALLACGVNHGIGYLGVSLAFGLTVLTMAYAIGHISGCHLNPAVTLGLLASGRDKDPKRAVAFIIAQCIGGIIAAALLFAIVHPSIPDSGAVAGTFATNGWFDPSVNSKALFGGAEYGMGAAFAIEAVLTCIFLFVIIGATDKRAPAGMGPIAIGLCLTLIHLISIPVTNTSVNPARSTAMAIFVGGQPVSQLWLFWVAPILGAVIAGLLYRFVFEAKEECCCGGKCKCDDCKCDKKEEKEEVKSDDKKDDKKEDKKED